MSEEKMVVFTFDEKSYFALKDMTEKKKFSTMGETVQESLAINKALQTQKDIGFSEVIVRDPKTGLERKVNIWEK